MKKHTALWVLVVSLSFYCNAVSTHAMPPMLGWFWGRETPESAVQKEIKSDPLAQRVGVVYLNPLDQLASDFFEIIDDVVNDRGFPGVRDFEDKIKARSDVEYVSVVKKIRLQRRRLDANENHSGYLYKLLFSCVTLMYSSVLRLIVALDPWPDLLRRWDRHLMSELMLQPHHADPLPVLNAWLENPHVQINGFGEVRVPKAPDQKCAPQKFVPPPFQTIVLCGSVCFANRVKLAEGFLNRADFDLMQVGIDGTTPLDWVLYRLWLEMTVVEQQIKNDFVQKGHNNELTKVLLDSALCARQILYVQFAEFILQLVEKGAYSAPLCLENPWYQESQIRIQGLVNLRAQLCLEDLNSQDLSKLDEVISKEREDLISKLKNPMLQRFCGPRLNPIIEQIRFIKENPSLRKIPEQACDVAATLQLSQRVAARNNLLERIRELKEHEIHCPQITP